MPRTARTISAASAAAPGDAQITTAVEGLLNQDAAMRAPNLIYVQTLDRVVYLSGQVATDLLCSAKAPRAPRCARLGCAAWWTRSAWSFRAGEHLRTARAPDPLAPWVKAKRLGEIELGRLVLLGNSADGSATAGIAIRADALSRAGDITEGVVRLGGGALRFERYALDESLVAIDVEYVLEPDLASATVRPARSGDLACPPPPAPWVSR